MQDTGHDATACSTSGPLRWWKVRARPDSSMTKAWDDSGEATFMGIFNQRSISRNLPAGATLAHIMQPMQDSSSMNTERAP